MAPVFGSFQGFFCFAVGIPKGSCFPLGSIVKGKLQAGSLGLIGFL